MVPGKMRRKSERTATKKVKTSPEKKGEKTKRSKTKRRKQSTSSENESDEGSPVREVETLEEPPKEAPPSPVKEDSPEEAQDQVWQVKTAESSGDGGEIKKLKICLTRPPSTPERMDRSPRSRRKHSRATSSSDTPSSEGIDEKKRSRRSRKNRESKDELDKSHDSQGDDQEAESEHISDNKTANEVSQSNASQQETDDTPMSTTNEEAKPEANDTSAQSQTESAKDTPDSETKSDADTTVASPKASEIQSNEAKTKTSVIESHSMHESVEKFMLEIHAEVDDNDKIESSESQQRNTDEDSKEQETDNNSRDQDRVSGDHEVSISQDKTDHSVSEEAESAQKGTSKTLNDVVASSVNIVENKRSKKESAKSEQEKKDDSKDNHRSTEPIQSDCTQSTQEETAHNGPAAAPIVVSRKRKWGSRPRLTSQKSITISTDVLKEIIPDVKPTEFNEVIEEKKHKRIEVKEKIERPVLPKIVIDNTESVEQNKKEEEEDSKENIKRDINLSAHRRISIVKENDSIITRPPSPPRHKQSNILYITNLVRPFTLPQLKNLLQRTGRLVENGFWIDRIKSKCFVQYENEDQAVETRHALHGVTWPVSNPKALQVDFSTQEAFDKARSSEETENAQTSSIPGTVEDWLREQDLKRERGELQEKPWERKAAMREWDVGKNDKDKDKDRLLRRDDRPLEKRRHRSLERSPEPARKFKKKEEEAPAKLLDDLFRKTKTTPCIYWLPLSAETIAIKEEQRRQHMAEHERRLQELRRHRERDRDRRH